MKLILIDGGPASGKNTVGVLLVRELQKKDSQVILLDLDIYVEKLNPSWIWGDEQKKEHDLKKARENFAKDINKYLQKDYTVIIIGERFLKKQDVVTMFWRELTENAR